MGNYYREITTPQEYLLQVISNRNIKIMNDLIDEWVKVSAVVCDPPFNLVEKSWGSIHLFRQSLQDGTNTVTEDNMTFDHWFNQTLWLKKACQLLKRGWNIIIFNDWENMWIVAYELRRLKIKVKTIGHWQKTNPMPSEWKRRFVPWREYFLQSNNKADKPTNVFPPRIAPPYKIKLYLSEKTDSRNSSCFGNDSNNICFMCYSK